MSTKGTNIHPSKPLSDLLLDTASQLEMLYQLRDNEGLNKDCEYLIPLLETAFFTDVSIAEILSYDEASNHSRTQCENNICYCFCEIAVRHGINHLCGWDIIGQSQQTKIGKLNSVLPNKKWKKEIIVKSNEFIQFCKGNNLFLKLEDDSNTSKHYDTDYIRVIQHLRHVGSEVNRKRANTYLRLLIDLKDLIARYIADNDIVIIADTSKTLTPKELKGTVIQHFVDFNKILTIIDNDEQFMAYSDKMMSDCERADVICKDDALLSTPKGKLYLETRMMKELFTPVSHIRYVELSICYAIKAYKESSDNLMKQFNLYRIVMAYYEGFKKLYGFSDKKEQPSLMRILHDYCENADNSILIKEAEVDFALKSIAASAEKYEYYRNVTTKNRDKGKDKVLEKFDLIIQLDPTELFKDVWQFLGIRRPLYELTDMLAAKFLPEYWQNNSEHKKGTVAKKM